jgi:hypothetical protein
MLDNSITEPNDDDTHADSEVEELVEPTDAEDEETELDGDDDDNAELEVIDIDGEEVSIDQIKEFKAGHMRQADYTRKTQDLANKRKATEKMHTELTDMIASLKAAIDSEESDINWDELLEEDSVQYMKEQRRLAEKKQKLEAAKAKNSEMLQNKQAEENGLLLGMMTEWKSKPKLQEKELADAKAYAKSLGFTDEEIGELGGKLADHRLIKAMIDGGRLNTLRKAKPNVKKKTSARKKVTPSSGTKPDSVSSLFYGNK